FGSIRPVGHPASGKLPVGLPPGATTARVPVPDVEPEDAILPEDSLGLLEDLHEGSDVLGKRRLCSDLSFDAIVAQAPVGRRGNDGLDRLIIKRREAVEHAGVDDATGAEMSTSWHRHPLQLTHLS